MARNVKANNADNSDRTPADHFLNLYINGTQIGYMVLDDQPAIVAKAQADSEFINRLLKSDKVTGIYRQRGKSDKAELDLDDI